MKWLEKEAKQNPFRMQRLREKFLNQVKKYFGVPYARKYWPKDCEYLYQDLKTKICHKNKFLKKEGRKCFTSENLFVFDTLIRI